MAEIDKAKAWQIYSTLIQMLDGKKWKYERYDDELIIKSTVVGDDLPIDFTVAVRPENQVIQFISKLPFNICEEKRVDGAIAVSVANYGLVDGSFDYDIRDGEIRFRLTCSYRDSQIGVELLEYVILCAATTVDRYNDRFFMLTKGMLTLQQFIEQDKA